MDIIALNIFKKKNSGEFYNSLENPQETDWSDEIIQKVERYIENKKICLIPSNKKMYKMITSYPVNRIKNGSEIIVALNLKAFNVIKHITNSFEYLHSKSENVKTVISI